MSALPTTEGPQDPQDRALRLVLIACKDILVKLQLIHEGQTAQYDNGAVMLHTSGPWICEGRADPYGNGECTYRNPARARRCRNCGGPRIETRHARTPRWVGSKPPPKVSFAGMRDAPDKDWSLYAHYEWWMQRAKRKGDIPLLHRLVSMATRDYEIYMGIRKAFYENPETYVTELLAYAGTPAQEVAEILHAPIGWVLEQRRLAGLDKETGEPRQLSDRDRQIIALASSGKPQVEIAKAFGISQQRVAQILKG